MAGKIWRAAMITCMLCMCTLYYVLLLAGKKYFKACCP